MFKAEAAAWTEHRPCMQSQVDSKKLTDCDPGGREGIPSLSMW